MLSYNCKLSKSSVFVFYHHPEKYAPGEKTYINIIRKNNTDIKSAD